MPKLSAERVILKRLTDAGANVYRMGTEQGVTWVEVWIEGHVLRVESEWQSESIAETVAMDLLEQIEARRPRRRHA